MQYTKQDGTTGELPTNDEQTAFAERAMEMLEDESVGVEELQDFVCGEDNPFENVVASPQGGLIIGADLIGTPQLEWIIEILTKKQVQLAPGPDSPLTEPMSKILEHSKVDELTLRRLVDDGVVRAKRINGEWMFGEDTLLITNKLARSFTMTTSQAAKLKGVPSITIRKMIESKRLKAHKIAGQWRMKPEDVDAIEVENRGPRTDKLEVKCGTIEEKWKLLFKADKSLTVSSKFTGGVEGAIEGQWLRAAVLTETKTEGDGPQSRRCFIIKYSRANPGNEIRHGELFVRGSFEIEQHTNNPIESKRMYDAFVRG